MHISQQLNTTFTVHPGAFVVHVPHKKPSTKWLTRRSGQKEKNHAIFESILIEIQKDRFVPVTSFPEKCVPSREQRAAARAAAQAQAAPTAEA